MKQHHLALTIQNTDEIHQFYENILGFQIVKTFELEVELANKIFNIHKPTQAFFMEGHGLALELFIDKNKKQAGFNHWCLSIPVREEFLKNAEKHNVEIIRIPRGSYDLIFIKDASGNIFEIKEDPK